MFRVITLIVSSGNAANSEPAGHASAISVADNTCMGSITQITAAIMTWLVHINDPKRMPNFPTAELVGAELVGAGHRVITFL